MAKWLIDQYIFKDENIEKIKSVFEKNNIEYEVLSYRPFVDDVDSKFNKQENVIVYGAVNFVQKTKAYFGNFCNDKNLTFHSYISNINIPKDNFLNSDFILIPYYRFRTNIEWFFDLYKSETLFIRPNSGNKLFTGMCINKNNYSYEFNSMKFLTGVCDDTILVVSSAKPIDKEYRFIIAGNEVIEGSLYNVGGKLINSNKNIPNEAIQLAKLVAQSSWKPDEIFTCDVSETNGVFKIIELNSFSCAGWYACDPEIVIPKITEFVDKLYREMYED